MTSPTSCSPISLPLFKLPYSLRHDSVEIRAINNLAITSKFLRKRKNLMSLALNKKLEIIMLNKEGTLKVKIGQKLGLSCQLPKL